MQTLVAVDLYKVKRYNVKKSMQRGKKMNCNQCPRRCGTDRSINSGFCGAGDGFRIARAALHEWEEPCISAGKGSGTVFFSGCSLGCVFCQNYDVSHRVKGADVSKIQLMRIFDSLIEQGAANINLVTPTHFTHLLAGVLSEYKSPVPVVWNSGGYESVESLRRLEGLVDIYLPDIKYFDSSVAEKYSKVPDYFSFASKAVLEMYRQVGNLELDENSVAKKGLLIRHLVLPGNVSQTYKIFEWISQNLPSETAVSLMRQYTPYGKAKQMPPLDRKLGNREYSLAKDRVLSLGFENCFFQKASSATENFIPEFSGDILR